MAEELTSFYDELGGEEVVRQLVDRFYDYMDELPEAADIRALHAKSLKASREKLFLFLSGWLGGPNLYIEKFGHPRLRARHLPFRIATPEAEQWLMCMAKALADVVPDERLRESLFDALVPVAAHMRNHPDVE